MKELTINCLCRVCLKNSHLHKSIYEGHSLDEFLVYELLNDVCDLGISLDDGLPEFLCGECFTKIIEFKSFKTNAHKGRSTLLLLKERVEYPIIKQEELEIYEDESEELVDGNNTKPIFGPILLKDEMLTVYNDLQQQEEVIESEIFVSVDAVESPATYMEDSTQEAGGDDSGSELSEEGAFREKSSDDDMEPLTLEPEDADMTDDDSTEVHVTLLDTDTHPQYLQFLEHKRPPCESEVTADTDSCTWSISTDYESVSEISKNDSLCVECETSSNGKIKTSGQCIHQRDLSYVAPSLQENIGNVKERRREEKGTGKEGEGLRATAPEKKLEGKEECLECYHCGKVFMSKHYLIQHMKVHGFDNSCDCEICINVSQTKVNLKCNDSTHTCCKPYICAECSKSFSQRKTLKAHIISHTVSKPYKCLECSKRFSQSDGLKVHMRSHTRSKPYKCTECSKSFSQSANLKTHLRLHTGSKPYKCLECSKSFRQSGHLQVHRRLHTGSKPYTCAECSKSFSQSESLKTHMRLHTKSKPYHCSECNKSFSQSANLKTHLRLHTGSKPYKCVECSKSFTQSGHLQAHRRLHTGSKPYTCTECSKSFSQSATLKVHMRLHTASKPYKCLECSKSFRHSVNLKTHLRTHTGLKPYKCADCNKSFSHSSSLKKHMRVHRFKTI